MYYKKILHLLFSELNISLFQGCPDEMRDLPFIQRNSLETHLTGHSFYDRKSRLRNILSVVLIISFTLEK